MHIAHLNPAEFLSVRQLEKLTGLKRRQIANLAKYRDIPGARLSANGYHYEYPDSEALREWIMWKQLEVKQRKIRKLKPGAEWPQNNPAKSGIANLPGIRMEFDMWHQRATSNRPLEKWTSEALLEAVREIYPIAVFVKNVQKILVSRIPRELPVGSERSRNDRLQ